MYFFSNFHWFVYLTVASELSLTLISYFVVLIVIGLVGHCCKLEPSVVIIIVIR